MEETLHDGQIIFVNKLRYGLNIPFAKRRLCTWSQPKAGDIVVYYYENNIVVKRIAGVQKQSLDYSEESSYNLIIEDKMYPLTEIQHHCMRGSFCIPDGTVMAIGDNHSDSIDSRNYGFIPVENILGKVVANE